jgi:hypothetical protein
MTLQRRLHLSDLPGDADAGLAGLGGQLPHFLGHHGKSAAALSGPCRFDRGVQREQVGGAADGLHLPCEHVQPVQGVQHGARGGQRFQPQARGRPAVVQQCVDDGVVAPHQVIGERCRCSRGRVQVQHRLQLLSERHDAGIERALALLAGALDMAEQHLPARHHRLDQPCATRAAGGLPGGRARMRPGAGQDARQADGHHHHGGRRPSAQMQAGRTGRCRECRGRRGPPWTRTTRSGVRIGGGGQQRRIGGHADSRYSRNCLRVSGIRRGVQPRIRQ